MTSIIEIYYLDINHYLWLKFAESVDFFCTRRSSDDETDATASPRENRSVAARRRKCAGAMVGDWSQNNVSPWWLMVEVDCCLRTLEILL